MLLLDKVTPLWCWSEAGSLWFSRYQRVVFAQLSKNVQKRLAKGFLPRTAPVARGQSGGYENGFRNALFLKKKVEQTLLGLQNINL